jgi:predicted porin
LTQYYSLSKRTGLYAAEGYQRASGKTLDAGKIVEATASIGDGFNGAPSSSRSQVGLTVGMIQRF